MLLRYTLSMVAIAKSQPAVAPMPDPAVLRMGYGPVRFSVDDALKMLGEGLLPEDSTIELLDGTLVYRDRFDLRGSEVVEGVKHNYVISAVSELAERINNDRRHLRTQSTLVCAEAHAPIPDAMVLRGTRKDYRERLPTAADAYCVVEVADSSYERDTGEKLAGYAKAGVAQYVVVNLRNRTAEVYTNPDPATGKYSPPQVVGAGEVLALRVGEGEFLQIGLGELLP